MVEATPVGVEARVVLARPPGVITCRSQHFTGECCVLKIAVAALVIQTGEQADPRRPTLGGVVHAREAEAILCQSIEMGCIHLAAVATDVGIAHVVHEDEYDVGALVRERSR